jgi:hypothetical protein
MFLLRLFCPSLACALSLACPLTSHAADGQTLQIRPEFPPTLRLTHITEGYALVAWTVLPDGGLDDARTKRRGLTMITSLKTLISTALLASLVGGLPSVWLAK